MKTVIPPIDSYKECIKQIDRLVWGTIIFNSITIGLIGIILINVWS